MKRTTKLFCITIGFFILASFVINKPQVQEIKSVKIGTQTWMAENLNTTTFRNGDVIPQANTKEEWDKAGEEKKPAWCYYDNNHENEKKYGKLYNWYAVNDPRGLAPKGWHVPGDDEWEILKKNLGEKPGTKMKSTSGWYQEGNGDNSSGFAGFPGGQRSTRFLNLGLEGHWWNSTVDFADMAYSSYLSWSGGVLVLVNSDDMADGLSVRCVKD